MKTILFIAESFPIASEECGINIEIAKSIRECGNNVILFSLSWCRSDSDNFMPEYGRVFDSEPFIKRYFLDPIQLRILDDDIITSSVGLLVKILESENIDTIVFVEAIKYGIIGEIIKRRYSIPIIMYICHERQLEKMYDDYVYPATLRALKTYDKIYCSDKYNKIFYNNEDENLQLECNICKPKELCDFI